MTRANKAEQLPVKNTHGGWRPGSGGGPKRMEIRSLKNEVLYLRSKYHKMPLHHFLDILNTDPPFKKVGEKVEIYKLRLKEHVQRQDWAAHEAAPFMHHRLSAIEISGPEGGPIHQKVDIRKLSEEELDALERLVKKAAIVTIDEDQYHEVE